MEIHFYKRHIGDYVKKTSELTLTEHGAYTVLLDHYYATKQPLAEDMKTLFRLCRAQDKRDRKAVEFVATKFFAVGPDGLRHNKRADQELAKMTERSNAAADAAEKRWHKPEDMPPHMQTQCYPEPEPEEKNTLSAAGGVDSDPAEMVAKARELLGKFMAFGPDWQTLTVENVLLAMRKYPKADGDAVVARLREKWLNQPLRKNPPTYYLNYAFGDSEAAALRKVAPENEKEPPRRRLPTPEELRERRMGGG